ncbi:hypothetical protein EO93_10270 [Methanosarcina sp. 1.H.A.2.2]|nr:hypothetical protein EO93_10270 [Methanosarcina sp. 1.H.A.2.2]
MCKKVCKKRYEKRYEKRTKKKKEKQDEGIKPPPVLISALKFTIYLLSFSCFISFYTGIL